MTKPRGSTPPRLIVELPSQKMAKLAEMFNYGERKQLFEVIVDTLIEIYDRHGKMALYALTLGKVSVIDILRKKEDQDEKTT
jgi:hypothetical protein